MGLRPYQKQACNNIIKSFNEGARCSLIVLPTGTGKTVVFTGVACNIAYKGKAPNGERIPTGKRVLVLAHQKILTEQADDKFFNGLKIATAKEHGKESCFDSPLPIVISTMQTMQKRLDKFPPDYFDLIIIDEAHHTETDGYKKIIDHFTDAKVLGVTATPDRADKKKLSIFDCLAYEYTIEQAQKDGYLAPLNVISTSIEIDLSTVKRTAGDLDGAQIGSVIEPHLHAIAKEVRRLAHDRRIVCFVPLIRTAKKAAEIFSHYGFRAAWTSGEDKEREEKLKGFQVGDYDIIFNSMLLTEGWDCPETDCVIVLRPTLSRALYVQMVGRGLRLAEGKKDCLLIDFLFQNSAFPLASPSDVLGPSKISKKNMRRSGDLLFGEITISDAEERLKKALEKHSHLKDPRDHPAWQAIQSQKSNIMADATPKQKSWLRKEGYAPDALSWSEADGLISRLKKEQWESKPVTSNQRWRLHDLGISTKGLNFFQASQILKAEKAKGRW